MSISYPSYSYVYRLLHDIVHSAVGPVPCSGYILRKWKFLTHFLKLEWLQYCAAMIHHDSHLGVS